MKRSADYRKSTYLLRRLIACLCVAVIAGCPYAAGPVFAANSGHAKAYIEPVSVTNAVGAAAVREAAAHNMMPAFVTMADSIEEFMSLTEPALDEATFEVSRKTGEITGTAEDLTFEETFGKDFDTVKKSAKKLEKTINGTEGYQVEDITKDRVRVASDYGLKRVMVCGVPKDICGAENAVAFDGNTVLEFGSSQETKEAYEQLTKDYGEENVILDVPMFTADVSGNPDLNEGDTDSDSADDSAADPDNGTGEDPDNSNDTNNSTDPSDDPSAGNDDPDDPEDPDDPGATVVPFDPVNKVDPDLDDNTPDRVWHGWGTKTMYLDTQIEKYDNHEKDLTVAVLDCGINEEHEIFDDTTIADGSMNCVDTTETYADKFGHGTMVSGIIAESTTSNVNLLVLKVMERDVASTVTVLQTIEYAVEQGADIINLSMGGYYNQTECAVIDEVLAEAASKNVLICASSGNLGSNLDAGEKQFYPASSPYCVSVGGMTKDLQRATYSNYGEALDFAAPSTELTLADFQTNNGYVEGKSGTSFACPYVVSCAAFLYMAEDKNSRDTILAQLIQISDDLGVKGRDSEFGYGMPNFANAEHIAPVLIKGGLKIAVSDKKYVYDGKVKKPSVTVTYDGRTMTSYKVTYPGNNAAIGTHKVKVMLTGNYKKKVTGTATFKIVPQTVQLKNRITVYLSGTKAVFRWTKSQGSYQLQLSKSRTFKNKKTYSSSKLSRTVTGLKFGQVYYIRIRAVKKVDGVKYYSPWSGTYRFTNAF